MPWGRIVAIAVAVAAVLWARFDSGWVEEPPGPYMSAPLLALGLVFGLGGVVMHLGGRPERVPLWAGLGIGVLAYAAGRLLLPV